MLVVTVLPDEPGGYSVVTVVGIVTVDVSEGGG